MGDLDAETLASIQALLREMRGWHPGVPEASLEELSERFNLPDLVVRRLADSEGFELLTSWPMMDTDEVTSPIEIFADASPDE